jgi:long-chain acyl-CoA synthetase
MNRTVVTMLRNAAVSFKNVAYVLGKSDEGYVPWTFAEVYGSARKVAATLLSRGFNHGDKLAILAEGSPEWVVGELGVLLAGATSVPLSIKLLAEEVPFRINHSEARAILVSKNQLPKLLSIYDRLETAPLLILIQPDEASRERAAEAVGSDKTVSFAELLAEGESVLSTDSASVDAAEGAVREDDVVTISYTSGTTGNPKGIMLSHLNYYANCKDAIEMFQVPLGYSTLLILPCDHSFGHTVGIYAALVRGISLYFVDARGGSMAILRNIPKNLKESNPVFLLTVPALSGNFMKKIVAAIDQKAGPVRALFWAGVRAGIRYYGDSYTKVPLWTRVTSWIPHRLADAVVFKQVRKTFGNRIEFFVGGGALLDVNQQSFFRAIGIPVYQGYGLTEAAPVISSNVPAAHKIGTSGRTAPSVTCRILREDGREAGEGETGEIVVRGENVMLGYFKNQGETERTIRDGWLHTGDLGHRDADGFLVVTGREKALLISSDGEKYSPEEIEEAIQNASPVIQQVMVYNDHKNFTTALVSLDEAAVRDLIQKQGVETADELLEELERAFHRYQDETRNSRRFPAQWSPRTFQIVPEPFSEENKMINSTMKMVRYRINEAYGELLDYMYTEAGGQVKNDKNRAVVRDRFDVE